METGPTRPTKYVLNVETAANWQADGKNAFSHLGIGDRRRKFYDTLVAGDQIITYVKATGFVDVRQVLVAGVEKLGLKSNYPDGAWPWRIKTELVASLGLDNPISPNQFPQTKLCSGVWRYRFQMSGKLIDAKDGEIIAAAIIRAALAKSLPVSVS